jgi:hypothetical protein
MWQATGEQETIAEDKVKNVILNYKKYVEYVI